MASEIAVHDDRFRRLVSTDSQLVKLHSGMIWAEGPVYFPLGDYLLWSDIPNNRVWQWMEGAGARLYMDKANNANGHTRDREGRLISCEHLTRRVTRTNHDGSLSIIADSFEGKRLNSPNDVVVKSDSSIWFTDPPYGILSDHEGKKAEQEQEGCFVFRCDPSDGALTIVADDFDKPNGLAFSPDEKILYVSDTGRSHDENGPHHIRAFDVIDGCRLANGRLFKEIEIGLSDGFRLDVEGNIWTSTGGGVQCFSSDGVLLGEIIMDEVVSNLTFGGPDNNRLFITATTSLYSISVDVKGAL